MQSRVHIRLAVVLSLFCVSVLGLETDAAKAQTVKDSAKTKSNPETTKKAPVTAKPSVSPNKTRQVGFFNFGGGRRSYRSRPYAPQDLHAGHAHTVGTVIEDTQAPEIVEGEIVTDDDSMFEFEEGAEIILDEGEHQSHSFGSGAPCSVCGERNCRIHWICLPLPLFLPETVSLFTGVHGSKAAPNRGQGGSFGFEEGFNLGSQATLLPRSGVGYQFGMRAVQSDFSGANFTTDSRNQIFATAGLFHRVDEGLQAGIAFDYLQDDWDYKMTMTQIRAELSWLRPEHHEWGFSLATSARDDTFLTQTGGTRDVYAAFYRYRIDNCGGGEARFRIGATDESEAVLGAEVNLPISDCWSLATDFVYLIPQDGADAGGFQDEVWNVGISLVWYPRRSARTQSTSYYRPLFNVAGNSSMLIGGQF